MDVAISFSVHNTHPVYRAIQINKFTTVIGVSTGGTYIYIIERDSRVEKWGCLLGNKNVWDIPKFKSTMCRLMELGHVIMSVYIMANHKARIASVGPLWGPVVNPWPDDPNDIGQLVLLNHVCPFQPCIRLSHKHDQDNMWYTCESI